MYCTQTWLYNPFIIQNIRLRTYIHTQVKLFISLNFYLLGIQCLSSPIDNGKYPQHNFHVQNSLNIGNHWREYRTRALSIRSHNGKYHLRICHGLSIAPDKHLKSEQLDWFFRPLLNEVFRDHNFSSDLCSFHFLNMLQHLQLNLVFFFLETKNQENGVYETFQCPLTFRTICSLISINAITLPKIARPMSGASVRTSGRDTLGFFYKQLDFMSLHIIIVHGQKPFARH